MPVWAPGVLLAALLGAAYLIAQPPAADLSAASYRSDLFARAGLTLWDNGWYAGHHMPGYSLLSPELGALLGPRLLLVLSTIAMVVPFGLIVRDRFGEASARIASAWLALGASVEMLSGRVPYTLGLAIALTALLLALRGLLGAALALAVLTAVASPVAGAFLAMAALAGALTAPWRQRRRTGPPEGPDVRGWAALAAAALVPVLLLALAFAEGGYEPFVWPAYWPAMAGVLAIAVLAPWRERAIRAGAVLYMVGMTGAYLLQTPVGGNAARLGAMFGGPLAAAGWWRRRTLLLLLVAPALLFWQLETPLRDLSLVSGDPSVHASYYAPLISELARLDGGRPVRVEVPLTGSHSEAAQLAGHVLLARGWERQLDTRFASLFYGPPLTAAQYRAWLSDNAVAYVALPDVRLDHAALAEGRLVAGGLPYLRPIWRSAHWRLYAVTTPQPLVSSPGRVLAVGVDRLSLSLPRPGAYTVRVRYTPYWGLVGAHGCVGRARGGWTSVQTRSAGTLGLSIQFSLERVLHHGPRCR